MTDIIVGFGLVAFVCFVAPAMIAHSKGRRWWVWLLLSFPFPLATLFVVMFAHPVSARKGKVS